ncbi:MAG: T9SS type A sorting domain-containing protein [Sphingomonadales bacterium]|nr:T9SS type A sorting domain-containing protein [Sphingomonadales bacterium]
MKLKLLVPSLALTALICFYSFFVASGQIVKQPRARLSTTVPGNSPENTFYTFSQQSSPYTALSSPTALTTATWDDPSLTVTLPFPFQVFGRWASQLVFDGLGGEMFAVNTMSQDTLPLIGPYAMDLCDRGYNTSTMLSPISYKTEGSAGSRIFKLEWKEAGSFYEVDSLGSTNAEMYISLQMWLFEGSNRIEFRYGNSLIPNPALFYNGEDGAIVGIGMFNQARDLLSAELLSGAASAPQWQSGGLPQPITGTPAPNTVYRFNPPGTTGLFESGLSQHLTAYPNPTQDGIWIRSASTPLVGKTEVSTAHILDVQGRPVVDFEVMDASSQAQWVDLSFLPGGVYLLQVEGMSGSMRIVRY